MNPVIANDDEGQQKLDARIKLVRENELADIRAILETPAGIRFFKRFFEEGKMFTTCMTGNSWTFHNEGKRDFVAKFFSDVCEAFPEIVPTLIMRQLAAKED